MQGVRIHPFLEIERGKPMPQGRIDDRLDQQPVRS